MSGYKLLGNGTRYCYTESFGFIIDLGLWSGINPFCQGICNHYEDSVMNTLVLVWEFDNSVY